MLGGSVVAVVAARVPHAPASRRRRRTRRSWPARPGADGKITRRSTPGINYELQNNGTAIAVDAVAGRAGAHRARREGPARSRPQPGMELFDKPEARRQRLPAAGRPTSARSRARSPARSARSTASAARRCSSCCPRTSSSQDQQSAAKAAVMLPTRQQPPAGRRRAASRSSSSGSVKGLARTTSRSPTRPARCCGRTPGGASDGRWPRRRSRPPRRATTQQHGVARSTRCSTQTLGPGKAQVQVNADLNIEPGDAGPAHVRQEGRAAPADQRATRRSRAAARQPAAPPARPPTRSRPTPAGGGSRTRTTSTRAHDAFGVDKKVTHTKIAPGAVNR